MTRRITLVSVVIVILVVSVLRGTPAGDRFIDLYYRHTGAVAGALACDSALRQDGPLSCAV